MKFTPATAASVIAFVSSLSGLANASPVNTPVDLAVAANSAKSLGASPPLTGRQIHVGEAGFGYGDKDIKTGAPNNEDIARVSKRADGLSASANLAGRQDGDQDGSEDPDAGDDDIINADDPNSQDVRKRADGPSDTQILQYALTLEHLENNFYSTSLKKYDDKAFKAAGFPDFVRGRFKQIAEHEQTHVSFLTTVLGKDAVQPCKYNFPVTDPKSFAALAGIFEGVGVSAYLGAAQYVHDPAYLTAAGSILTTESRHSAWIGSAVNKGTPWSGSFDTPLDFDQVYSLAAQFIVYCPKSNPALPFKAFPKLAIDGSYAAGEEVYLIFDHGDDHHDDGHKDGHHVVSDHHGWDDAHHYHDDGLFLALFSGLTTTFVPIENHKAVLPKGLDGTVYAIVTSSGTAVSDDNTVAGPAILSFPFNSQAVNF